MVGSGKDEQRKRREDQYVKIQQSGGGSSKWWALPREDTSSSMAGWNAPNPREGDGSPKERGFGRQAFVDRKDGLAAIGLGQ